MEDIYAGSRITFDYSRKSLCKGCDGTGTDNPAARRKCAVCQGKGEKIVMQRMGIMLMQNAIDCESCNGVGWEKNEFICEDCNGKMVVFEKRNFSVDLEKGTPDGYRFSFFGEGDKRPRIQDGDLIVEVIIKKHKYFRREGADLWYRLDIGLLEALTGFTKIIPSINGMERIEVSTKLGEVVQNGEVRVILGKGLPFFNNPKKVGNLFVEFNIVFPHKINEEKILKVEELLSERKHNKVENIEEQDKKIKSHERETYFLAPFKSEDSNISVSGGKIDKEKFSKIIIFLNFL